MYKHISIFKKKIVSKYVGEGRQKIKLYPASTRSHGPRPCGLEELRRNQCW